MKNKFIPYMRVALLFVIVWGMGVVNAFAQCPMCKAAVESGHGEEPNPLAEGLNSGIIYLFVLPYLTFALIGFIWYRNFRKKKKQEKLEQEMMDEQQSQLPRGLQFGEDA